MGGARTGGSDAPFATALEVELGKDAKKEAKKKKKRQSDYVATLSGLLTEAGMEELLPPEVVVNARLNAR